MKASKVMNMRHISSVSFPSFNGVHNHNTTATSQEHYFYRIPWSPSHSAQGNYIDLNQYYKRQGVSCSANMNPQFVVFQEFISTLANMEKSLTIEENLYTLNTLLSGYEKIYRKLGYAFIHQKCCLITKAGEVRAWINMDPAKSYPDHSVIKQEQMKDLSRNRTSTKALLSTEASICKGIVKMSLCLSDGNREFFNFYEKLRIFMVKNMQIQNLSFRSIRTFLNAYIYENRIIVAKNIYKALQRYHQTEIERKSDKTYTFQVKDSIASDKAHLQQDQYRSYKANSKNSLKKSYLTSEQKQIFLPINTQYSSSNIGKSSNISSKASQRKHMKSYSTNFCTPTHKQDQSTNYLATSTQHMNSRLDLRQENVRKIFEGLQKMTKNQKYFKKVKFDSTGENQNPINKSMFVKQQQSITSKSNVKFHSREQSEVGYFDQTQNIQKIAKDISNIPSYKFNHLKDSNSSQFYSQKNQHENNSQNGSQQPFKRRQSRTFTRFVSGLLQNDQLFVCESEGSFQSIKMKEDVPYSGVLLQMGRSVQAVNDPPPKSKSNHRTVLSGIPNSAFDF